MSQKKKITILLPVHQRTDIEINFDTTIRSILKNIDNNFLLNILIDGKLTKQFEKKIKNYQRNNKYSNIKITKSSKVGLSKLLNLGIKKAQTKWIARADSDDIYTKNYFKEGLKLTQLKNKQLDLFGGQIIEFDELNKLVLRKKVPIDYKNIKSKIKFRNPFNHMTVFFKKDLAVGLGGYPNVYLKEDYALWIKLIHSGARFCNSKKIFAHARTADNFYERRQGFKHLYSEIQIQKLLLDTKLTNFVTSFLVLFSRIFLLLMPSFILKIIYKNLLRL